MELPLFVSVCWDCLDEAKDDANNGFPMSSRLVFEALSLPLLRSCGFTSEPLLFVVPVVVFGAILWNLLLLMFSLLRLFT